MSERGHWRVSWRVGDDDERGCMYVTADRDEIDERVKIMSEFPTFGDVQAETVPDDEWAKILKDPLAYVAPSGRII